jgi:hypothetical protein
MTKNPSSHSPLKHHSAPIDGSPSTVHLHTNAITSDYVHGITNAQKHSHNSMVISQEPPSPLSCHVPISASNRSSAHVSMANSTFHSNASRTLPRGEHKLSTINVINTSGNSATLGHQHQHQHQQRHSLAQEMRV